MSPQERISVCIPVYNAAKYLPACLGSVLQQTYPATEIVILDDASSDGSLTVATQLAKEDARIKVSTKEHTALGDTRNRVIRSSSCELIAFLDADDIAEPYRLEKQVAFMNTHPQCVGLGGQVRFLDEFGHPFYRHPWQPQAPADVELQLLRGRASTIWQSSLMLRRSAFEKVGGYNSALNCSEDLDLYLRLVEIGELWNLPDVLVHMRRHPQSTSSIDRYHEVERRRASILVPAWKRRGITDLPLYELGTEPASRAEWYARTARGYLDAGSPRIALVHWFRGLREDPFSRPVWRAAVRIAWRIVACRGRTLETGN